MKVKPELPDNCRINIITPREIEMSVSININRELVKFLPKQRVGRGKKYCVYFENTKLSRDEELYSSYRILLNKAMLEVRKAKIKLLKSEVETIQLKLF